MRIPEPLRRPLVQVYNRSLALRSSRERSVKNVARGNTRNGFEEIFASQDLLAEYLSPNRLMFYEEIAELCKSFAPRRVIDVGCGSGHLLAALVQVCPTVGEVVGVDYAKAAITRLNEVLPRARGVVSTVHDLDLRDETFDLVLCTEVLEHLYTPHEALAVLARLCEPSGRLVITVPDGELDDFEGHVNFWSANQFRAFLAGAGIVEVSRSQDNDLIAIIQVPESARVPEARGAR